MRHYRATAVAVLAAAATLAFAAVHGGGGVAAVTVVQGVAASATPSPAAVAGMTDAAALSPEAAATWPTTAPAAICRDIASLSGPGSAPAGAITIPAGNNLGMFNRGAGVTYWLAPGLHTFGPDRYAQIRPADDTTFLGAPGAIIDGKRRNLYAFTGDAHNVTIRYLTIRNFGTGASNNNEGVVNHDAGDGWRIANNVVEHNDGAGVFVGSNDVINDNCLRANGQYGFSAYAPAGVRNIVIDHNEIVGNDTDDWETRIPGCGCTGGAKFWDTHGAVVTRNWVHDNRSVGLWADTNNTDFRIEGNYFSDNDAEALFYEISYNAAIRDNTFARNALVKGRAFAARGDDFPVAAIYLSEAGGDARLGGAFSTIEISGNLMVDNWSGIALWENADRFCNSPANTSSGSCTLVPGATLDTCVAGRIGDKPLYDDCRWKTQNVSVHDNVFRLDKAKIACASTDPCGRMAVLSNYGSYPDWSPYKGFGVADAITLHQNNVFRANRYVGDWTFVVHDPGQAVGWTVWRGSPYGQDRGSSMRAAPTAS